MNSRTGKGTRQILLEALGLNFDAIVWLLWASIAHPENAAVKDASPDKVALLFDPQETGAIVDVLGDVVNSSFMKPKKDEAQDPLVPTTQP